MYIMTNLSQDSSAVKVTSHGMGGPGLKSW